MDQSLSKGDKFPVSMGRVFVVVWGTLCITPDVVSTLLALFNKTSIHLYNQPALSHILAVPAQLRNRVWRSRLEKKRSKTTFK